MIVKILVTGAAARISTDPREKGGLEMVVPAHSVRRKFAERADRLLGYFHAEEADSSNTLEIGDRVPTPDDPW